jgi:hypothetical protein
MASDPIPVALLAQPAAPPRPWALPPSGLTVFYGRPETPRLFHYFLPRLLAEGRQVLCLDGANRFDPLLLARLARQRGRAPGEFNRCVRVARAFTCFQLTELLARVPRLLGNFPTEVLIVTAFPDLYFDEDVREHDAGVAFQHALDALRVLRPVPLSVAVFSDATSFQTPRQAMFRRLAAQATGLWRFALDEGAGRLRLRSENLPLDSSPLAGGEQARAESSPGPAYPARNREPGRGAAPVSPKVVARKT